jgi:hypothetical protein
MRHPMRRSLPALGDRPLITGVWRDSLDRPIIWRIAYAEPDEDEETLLASLDERVFSVSLETVDFSFDSPRILIFDSAWPGDEIADKSISFEIPPGRYRVTTHLARPTVTSEFILHRFEPIK